MTFAVFAWGASDEGQIGSLDYCPSPRNYSLEKNEEIKQISCGYKHSLVLLKNGSVFSAGSNEFGELGRHANGHDMILQEIQYFNTKRIVYIASGAYHCAAIDSQGKLYTWGCNINGQLGRSSSDFIEIVQDLSGHRIVQISLGLEHSIALTETSEVFTWGANYCGQLGLGLISAEPFNRPQELIQIHGLPIRQVCAGGKHSLVLTTSGSIYSWGNNEFGQLGLTNTTNECLAVPNLIKNLKNQSVCYLACGENHSIVLTKDGRVYSFGSSRFGQLGHNEPMTSCPNPKIIETFIDMTVSQIGCGRLHSLIYTKDSGKLYSFGANMEGQLGHGNEFQSALLYTPKSIALIDKQPSRSSNSSNNLNQIYIVHIYSGGDHNFVLTSSSNHISIPDFRSSHFWSIKNKISSLNIPVFKTACDILCVSGSSYQRRDSISQFLVSPSPGSADYQEDVAQTSNELKEFMQHMSPLDKNEFIIKRLEMIYSSLGCLASSCLISSEKRTHFNLTRNDHGLDIDLAYKIQHEIFRILEPTSVMRISKSLINHVLTYDLNRGNFPGIECLRAFIFLSVCPLLDTPRSINDRDYSQTPVVIAGYDTPYLILNIFAQAINKLDPLPSKILDSWLSQLQPRYFRKLLLRHIRAETIKNGLELMKRLYSIVEISHPEISPTSFYIPELKSIIDARRAFISWLQKRNPKIIGNEVMPYSRVFSFCDYPFIFEPEIKTQMLTLEAKLQMRSAMNEAQSRATSNLLGSLFGLFEGHFNQNLAFMGSDSLPILRIEVNRNKLVQDTINQLAVFTREDLKKPLSVKFEGEEAVDEGGVMKEFFLLIMREVLNPIYGMFICNEESRVIWFSDKTMESDVHFGLVGVLCGLAIYNSIIVDLTFPLVLFKKLLEKKPVFEDLKEYDPILADSLERIIDFEDENFEDVFCLDFSSKKNTTFNVEN